MPRKTHLTMLFMALLLTSALAATPALAGFGFLDERGVPIYSSTKAVGDAQAILEGAKYLGPGSYQKGQRDQATIEAIRQFQRVHSLSPTGTLDSETMGLLMSHGRQAGFATAIASGWSAGAPHAVHASRRQGSAASDDRRRMRMGDRTMPETGSPVALLAGLGGLLVAGGLLLLYVRRS